MAWAERFDGKCPVGAVGSLRQLQNLLDPELKLYFALAALSRSHRAPTELVANAHRLVFRSRVMVERMAVRAVDASIRPPESMDLLFEGSFFGTSKKQGVSVRMPLSSCTPTKLCAGSCYAHDVLDAAPASILRGAINGVSAKNYEAGDGEIRTSIQSGLAPHVQRAVRAALGETKHFVPGVWSRRPYIRFSHVGEIVAFPQFANMLATMVRDASGGAVDCVVYTRLKSVSELDPDLWVINFTLDKSSMERKSWIPAHARTVFSAFGGEVSEEADVNFLEHHRWSHLTPIGNGRVCPATAPNVPVRTCDAVRCARCFVRPVSVLNGDEQ